MASRNDITGDKIQSKTGSIPEGNWEAIFGPSRWDIEMAKKKKKEKEEKEREEINNNKEE